MTRYRPVHLNSGDATELEYDVLHALVCCSCGLAHRFILGRGRKAARLVMWRDNRMTNRERKKMKP